MDRLHEEILARLRERGLSYIKCGKENQIDLDAYEIIAILDTIEELKKLNTVRL